MLSNMMTTIVRLNGLYDILCGSCLLKFISIPVLNKLHSEMFHPELISNDFACRLLGYWIITYGSIRLCHNRNSPLVSLSYYIEAIVLLNEMKYHQQFIRLFFTATMSAYFGHIYALLELRCT